MGKVRQENVEVEEVEDDRALLDLVDSLSRQGRDLAVKRNKRYAKQTIPKEWQYLTRAVLDWSFANTIGVLGPRGSGKSTILEQLFWHGREKWAERSQKPVVLPAIDCSALHTDLATSPAAVVLQRIRTWCMSQSGTNEDGRICRELDRLIADYCKAGDKYLKLCSDLSETAGTYCEYVAEAIRMRMNLQSRLEQWLDDATEHYQKRCFVVMLDDFDLASRERVTEWQRALMDELHQLRLLVVLTADFYRLDKLSSDESDERLGRALLGKYLPPSNRVFVSPWCFGLGRQLDGSKERLEAKFDALVEKAGLGQSLHLLRNLYPTRPRSIANLSKAVAKLEDDYLESDKIPPKRLVELLASSRGELLLAKAISEQGFDQWIKVLPWADGVLSAENWNEVVQLASARGRPAEIPNLRPLSALFSAPDIQVEPQLRPLRDAHEDSRDLWAELFADLSMSSPEIDKSLKTALDNTHYRYRSRIRVFQGCKPLSLLGNAAQFSLRYKLDDASGREALRDALRKQCAIKKFTLTLFSYWFEGRLDRNRIEIEIGCPPLLSALAGNRDRWPLEVYQEINFTPDGELRTMSEFPDAESQPPLGGESNGNSEIEGLEPEFGDLVLAARPLSVLPRQLWAMTLLVDGLHRAPWSAFSGVKLDFHILVGLSGAFTMGAYLYALVRCGAVEEAVLTGHQQDLVKCVRDRDAAHLVNKLSVPEIVEFVSNFYQWREGRNTNLQLPKKKEVAKHAGCLYAAANKLSKLSIMTDLLKVKWNE